jgi:hypothetical protein
MPCKYAIAMGGQLVAEQWTGTLTRGEPVAHKKRLSRDPSIRADASNQLARSGKSALIFNRLEAACQWLRTGPTHVRELIGRIQG